MCTGITARVRDVILADTWSRAKFQVSGSTSTNTGTHPASIIAIAQEIIVNDGRITSEPGSRSSAFIAICRAHVPFATATPYDTPQ